MSFGFSDTSWSHRGLDRVNQVDIASLKSMVYYTLREAVLELNLLTAAEFDAIVDPAAMTGDTIA